MKKELLCVQDLPEYIRHYLNKHGAKYPTKGNFYNAVDESENNGHQYYELAEIPPSDVGGHGVMPHYWDKVLFVEADDMLGELERRLAKEKQAVEFYAGYGCRHNWIYKSKI